MVPPPNSESDAGSVTRSGVPSPPGLPSVDVEVVDTKLSRKRMRQFMERAFPLTRSITGNGVRNTLDLIELELDGTPLLRHEVPSGTPVLDWVVPNEWNLTRATLDGPLGRVISSDDSNLHVVSYSTPVEVELTLDELKPHIYTMPDQPDVIPYRTTYYRETWGLCMTQRQLDSLTDGTYRVTIEATLEPGHLTYGEVVLPGMTDEEILLTTHICHPSMANDNLSGIAALSEVVRRLALSTPLHHTIRVLFIPGTIGSITWLERNRKQVDRIRAGLVLAGAGDRAPATYKRSRRGSSRIDLVMERLVGDAGGSVIDYYPYGYDERQFCSPGFDLPMGRLSRSIHGTYPQYHTSADDLDFVDDDTLLDTVELVLDAVAALDGELRYVNTQPHGEPQLGRRGLYGAVGGAVNSKSAEMALLWLLAYSDGEHSLADIARLANLPVDALETAAEALVAAELLKPAS
jgi:aminopeptidase-like protein